jgi:uncharacterized protein (TIGR01777 family)
MNAMTVVIAGGSGFLGRKLAKKLESQGHRTITLTRRPDPNPSMVTWTPDGQAGSLPPHLEGVDAVVNLAGEGIADRRWSESRKRALHDSRILSTRTLARAIAACARPPKVLVSGSGVGYYGPHGDDAVTEATPAGTDYLARLCVQWEQEAQGAASAATRVAIVRTGLALDGREGALARMLLPFKLGLGATLGSGRQFMPWIHVDDWTSLVAWLAAADHSGAFNATAPEPVTNREFTRTLAAVLRRPAVFRAPAFVLQAALGELASVLLEGQRVLPARASQMGFTFAHHHLEPALRSLNL